MPMSGLLRGNASWHLIDEGERCFKLEILPRLFRIVGVHSPKTLELLVLRSG